MAPTNPRDTEAEVVSDLPLNQLRGDLGRTNANDRIDSLRDSAEAYANCVYNVGLGAGENGEFDLESWSRKYGHICERAEAGAKNAESVAEDIYHDDKDHLDGREDAMRHCTWHAFMAQDPQVGPQNARIVGRVYEMMGANDADSAQMDTFNNEFGVRLFETGRADAAKEAVASCRAAVDAGDLIVLNP